jgi:xanthine/CO dehydrogenase XdhC/CoxF family maturation factor
MQRAERIELKRHIIQSIQADAKLILCELVKKQGSFYRDIGFQCAVNSDGVVVPFIAGTCTDRLVAQLVQRREASSDTKDFHINIDTGSPDDRWMGSGAGCGGVVEFRCRELGPEDLIRLDEWIGPEICTSPTIINGRCVPADPRLWIFGGADDAFNVVRLAQSLGWVVHLVDHRDIGMLRQRCPQADVIMQLRPDSASDIHLLPDDHVIIMSHNIDLDLGWLEFCADLPPASIGLLGPVKRGEMLLQELDEARLKRTKSRIRLRCGAGISTRSPQHIALSMMTELQQLMEASAEFKVDSLRKGGRVEVWHRH